jgi:concentrative nucleoside transporter, CNT family
MNSETPQPAPSPGPPVPSQPPLAPTPLWWRIAILGGILAVGLSAYLLRDFVGPRGQAGAGIVCFIGIAALFSTNLRAVSWRTVFWGLILQLSLALFVMKLQYPFDVPKEQATVSGYMLFDAIGKAVEQFLKFTDAGSQFVFGPLANRGDALNKTFGKDNSFVFAFQALPTIIFASAFFTILFYFGVLQFIVRIMARVMIYLMRTSGAESLAAAANVFLGQTEAPLIIKPYVAQMTKSELLALMVGGMATISGGIMAVYIGLGADPVAILATSVMAAPCGLYLAKLLLPETETPQTLGLSESKVEMPHRNVIDAAAAGASDGLSLALNVAAMLIAFLALIAMVNYLMGMTDHWLGLQEYWGWSERLSLKLVFSWVFAPVAFLMGVEWKDIPTMGDLLGTKLVANEFVAYINLTTQYRHTVSPRTYILATYALTGFANFASVGIQLGGIGAMAPSRRGDLAELGMRALLGGFLATLVNAALAGMLL